MNTKICEQIGALAKAGLMVAKRASVDAKRIEMLERDVVKLTARVKALEADMNTHCHYGGSRGERIPKEKL